MTELLVIDIGSSQISAAIANISSCSGIEVFGLAHTKSGGLKQGVVIQIDAVVEALKRVVSEANAMAGTHLSNPIVSIGGTHLSGQDFSASISLNGREVTDSLLVQSMEYAQTQVRLSDREILSVIPRSFTLDRQSGIRLPHGMTGQRLKADAHAVTGASYVIANLKKCLRLANLEASLLVPSAVAVGQMVLEDERNLGVCVVDIGLSTTDLLIISDGAPVWTQVLPVGGELLTHDLVVALNTPLADAERLKVQSGYAHTSLAPPKDTIYVKKFADRPAEKISLQQLSAFLQPRVEEIAEIVGAKLRDVGRFEEASTGLVLSGGTSQLPGIAQVFESVLQCPCRVLKQANQDGLEGLLKDPSNAVLAGLLAYGHDHELQSRKGWLRVQRSVFEKVQKWIRGNF